MTDQDLLKLLEEKRPVDLTEEELEFLRQRLPASAELQQVVFSDIHLEQAISAAEDSKLVAVTDILKTEVGRDPQRAARALEAILAGASPDCREGIAAFLEKRPARFTGRKA